MSVSKSSAEEEIERPLKNEGAAWRTQEEDGAWSNQKFDIEALGKALLGTVPCGKEIPGSSGGQGAKR